MEYEQWKMNLNALQMNSKHNYTEGIGKKRKTYVILENTILTV